MTDKFIKLLYFLAKNKESVCMDMLRAACYNETWKVGYYSGIWDAINQFKKMLMDVEGRKWKLKI